MHPSTLLLTLSRFLLPPALISTTYLYLYPAAHGCAFPEAQRAEAACIVPGQQKAYVPPEAAPFRLLALGDPQLEGDTSLPDVGEGLLGSFWDARGRVLEGDWAGARETVRKDAVRVLQRYRKELDLWGNDLYLAHIHRSVSWWTQPTHTVVLGDLLGSQWIGDEEFQRRTDRFWKRVFQGAEKVPYTVTDVNGRGEVFGTDESWQKRIIAVAGNHDVGYAGDLNEHRIERFEQAYGRVNWDSRFRLESNATSAAKAPGLESSPLDTPDPELHLIILNSMNLDDPAHNAALQTQSRAFIDSQLHSPQPPASTTGTILLTHIPFHKEPGICVDAPFFSYFPPDQGGGIREQNHLSKSVSDHILNGLARGPAVVLNGHDHEGCDTLHFRERQADAAGGESWNAKQYLPPASEQANGSFTGLREITVRSMMGSFHGNAGLLSAWFDREAGEWRFEYDVCMLGVQHIWWAVHVLDLVVLGLGIAGIVAAIAEAVLEIRKENLESAIPRVNGKVKKA